MNDLAARHALEDEVRQALLIAILRSFSSSDDNTDDGPQLNLEKFLEQLRFTGYDIGKINLTRVEI